MSLCVGIDLSTKRIDLAAIPLDPDETGGPWRYTLLSFSPRGLAGTDGGIGYAIRHMEGLAAADVVTLAVEKPAGRFVHPSLYETYGAIVASIPQRIGYTTGLYPVEWRQAIGLEGKAKNNKAAGNQRVRDLYPACAEWDEHALDALGIATAWRSLQWAASPP